MELKATSTGFFGEEGMLRKAARMLLMASWQMVGSSKVGFRGLREKIGGRPMPEMMRSTHELALSLGLEGALSVRDTLRKSRTSPWTMVRCLSMVDWGTLRSRRRVWSFEDERDTEVIGNKELAAG